jgi:hypothetical protein
MIRRRRTVPEAELLTVIGERDAARQDVATLTGALRCALTANDDLRRECAAVEERADRLGDALQWEHAAARHLRQQVEEYEVRYGRLASVTVSPSGLLSGEVSPGCSATPASTAETSVSSPADAPADDGTVTP